MNPYEPSSLASKPPNGFSIKRTAVLCTCFLVFFFSCYASYIIGWAHGYNDGNTDRMERIRKVTTDERD